MKIKRIEALQELISKQKRTNYSSSAGFNMNWIFHSCGTPSCIAGFASTMKGFSKRKGVRYDVEVAKFLNIPEDTACRLCYPKFKHSVTWDKITPRMAVKALENVKNGCDAKSVWSHVRERSEP